MNNLFNYSRKILILTGSSITLKTSSPNAVLSTAPRSAAFNPERSRMGQIPECLYLGSRKPLRSTEYLNPKARRFIRRVNIFSLPTSRELISLTESPPVYPVGY
jgi:hypothetical protein